MNVFSCLLLGRKKCEDPVCKMSKIDVSNRMVFDTQKTNNFKGHECILLSQSDQNVGGVKMLEPRNKLRKDLLEKIYIKAVLICIKLMLWELSF